MKRLGRWLFNLGEGAWILLFLATAVLWGRGYWIYQGWATIDSADNYSILQSGGGVISFARAWNEQRTLKEFDIHALGFRYRIGWIPLYGSYREHLPAGQTHDWETALYWGPSVQVPYWAIVTVLLFPLLVRGWTFNQRRRRANNCRCVACGYDLRATPERCPECGTAPMEMEEATP